MPSTRLDNIFYVSSGSEATDNAIKIARVYTGKSNIIAMNRGFHGRTIAALSITSSNTVCKNGISPLLPNIFFCHEVSQSHFAESTLPLPRSSLLNDSECTSWLLGLEP